jgi:hypothetical protein
MTPGKDMDYEARKKAWEERYKKFRKMVGNFEREYGPKSGWAGVVQSATRIFNAAMENPLGALVGVVAGLGMLVAGVVTGGALLPVLAAAGAAAFFTSLGVGLADNLLFGGKGGSYVERTLGDVGTGMLVGARNGLMLLGAIAGGILEAAEVLSDLGYVGRLWTAGSKPGMFGPSWAELRDFLRGNVRNGFGIGGWSNPNRFTFGRVKSWEGVWGRRAIGVPGEGLTGGYPELIFGEYMPGKLSGNPNVGASFAQGHIAQVLTFPVWWQI